MKLVFILKATLKLSVISMGLCPLALHGQHRQPHTHQVTDVLLTAALHTH